MLGLIRKMFIRLLSFNESLATKYVSIIELYITSPTLIELNPNGLNNYPFMTSPDKCNRSCMAVYDLSTKERVPSKTKDVNGKVFNIITRINKGKTLAKHILCDYNCKFDSTTCNSNQK